MKLGKNVRNCFAIVLVFSVLLTLCGCGSNNQEKQEIKIGISIYDEYDMFVSSVVKNIMENCKGLESEKKKRITVEFESAKGNQLIQNDQVEKFINKDFDVILVNLVDRTDASLIIEKAKASGTPIIFFNRELVYEDLIRWDKLYYVGARPEESGRLQAEIIVDTLHDREQFKKYDFNEDGVIQYVMLEGEVGHQDAMLRTKTSVEGIKEAGIQVEKLGDEIANWNRIQAKTKIAGLLRGYPWQIEMIIANNDEMALGVIEELTEKGIDKWPLIVGVDGTEEALQMVQTGRMRGTVYNDAKGQAKSITDLAYGLAMDGKVPEGLVLEQGKYIFLPYQKVIQQNVNEYLFHQ